MTLPIRSFQQCVDAFAASRPGKKLRAQAPFNYDSTQAHAFEDLTRSPRKPPVTSLYLQTDPFTHRPDVLGDPSALLDYLNLGNVVGTWNAYGRATWQHHGDQWIIADVDLGRDLGPDSTDDDFDHADVSAIFALWKVEEGYAAALWHPSERASLVTVMGWDAWPADGWQHARVRYGE